MEYTENYYKTENINKMIAEQQEVGKQGRDDSFQHTTPPL